jgi:methionyl-tRNA formyltransferase
MSAKLDAGPILVQDAVPIDETVHLDQVVQHKSTAAAKTIPRLLERLAAGDPGRPQERAGSFYSAHDWMAMVNLSRPENATRKEILRRIRAFGLVNLAIGDKLGFRTADNQSLAPDRFRGLPSHFYRFGPDSTD